MYAFQCVCLFSACLSLISLSASLCLSLPRSVSLRLALSACLAFVSFFYAFCLQGYSNPNHPNQASETLAEAVARELADKQKEVARASQAAGSAEAEVKERESRRLQLQTELAALESALATRRQAPAEPDADESCEIMVCVCVCVSQTAAAAGGAGRCCRPGLAQTHVRRSLSHTNTHVLHACAALSPSPRDNIVDRGSLTTAEV